MLRIAAVVLTVLGIIVYVTPSRPCADDKVVCLDGSIVARSGLHCDHSCPTDGTIRAGILWNAPLHSWTGIASEAVDFLVPLARRLPGLALVGGYVDSYIYDLPVLDQTRIAALREKGKDFLTHDMSAVRIYLTQYAPGTYMDDADRHHLSQFDYRIGRAMFETTMVPSTWLKPLETVDEIWVPSTWGAERFVEAGVRTKIFVVPEAIDTSVFDPELVPRNRSLLPGSEGKFAFLSIGKWEARKGFLTLLEAFVTTFTAADPVALYLRTGTDTSPKWDYDMLLSHLKIKNPPTVVFLPKVSQTEYVQLYRAADAFVLATHAEGWGRPIMEAMAMGLPTIATGWSGQTEFMSDRTSFMVPASGLEEAFRDEPALVAYDHGHKWARLDPANFGKTMRYVFQNRNQAAATGRRARQHIVNKYSREAVAKIVETHFKRIIAAVRAQRQPRRVDALRHDG